MHDAFISYSRRNADFARRLEKALEEFKPARDLNVPQRYLDVFRDETDFTGVEYFQSVERHLGDSAKLIVICSPQARASVYVGDEVRRFGQKHGPDHIIPILLDGIPNNEASPGQEAECAFPEALCETLGMPLAISYRGFDARKDRVGKGAFADSWFALLANLYGISRADVERREKRRQQRRRRITTGIVTGIMTSLAIALVVSLLFWRQAVAQRGIAETARDQERSAKVKERVARLAEAAQRKVAEERRQEAERQRAAAIREAIAARSETAGRLAVQALEKIDGAPDDALDLGILAVDTFHTHGDPIVPRAMGALQHIGLGFAGSRPVLPWRKGRSAVVVDDRLEWAAASDARGTIMFGGAGTSDPRMLSPPQGVLQHGERWADEKVHLAFAEHHLIAVRGIVNGKSNVIEKGILWFWRLGSNGITGPPVPAGRLNVDSWNYARLQLSPNGRWLLWDEGQRGAFLQRIDPPGQAIKVCWGECTAREFTDDSAMLFIHANGIHRYVLGNGEATEQPALETEVRSPVNLAVISPDRSVRRLALFGENGSAEWWEIKGTAAERHALPNFFEAFTKDLEVLNLYDERVRTSLAWDSEGEAIMATVAEEKEQAFGIGAVHDLKDGAWQPVQHRYELKASETASHLQGSEAGVSGGYKVRNAGNLGLASAIFYGSDVISTGFDGTVLYRKVNGGRVGEKFKLVDTNASFVTLIGKSVVVGKRDGKVQLGAGGDYGSSAPLNGHGAPITGIKCVMDWNTRHLARVLSTDSKGITRIWDMTSPGAGESSDDVRVTPDWKWMITNEHDGGMQFWPIHLPEPLWAPRKNPGLMGAKAVAWNEDASQVATLHVEPAAPLPVVIRLWKMTGERLPRAPVVERRFAVATHDETSWSLWLATSNGEARVLIDDHSQLWMTDLAQPQQPLRTVGGAGLKLDKKGASDDLRWLVVKRGKQAFVADTRQWGSAPKLIPLGADIDVEAVEAWSPDRRWLVISAHRFSEEKPEVHFPPPHSCIVDLTVAPLRPIVSGGMRNVLFGAGRPPLIRDYDDDQPLRMLQSPGQLVRVAANPKQLAWDASGRWLAIGHDGGRVWLTQPAAGITAADLGRTLRSIMRQPPLPLPAEVGARGEIERVFPFPEQGWVVATVDRYVLVWLRRGSGWDPPLVFTKAELHEDEGVAQVRLRADGRMALVGNQLMSFDPGYLMAYSRRLANGVVK
jgi:hypothetical protein